MAGLPKLTREQILDEVLHNDDCIVKNSKKKNEKEKLRDMLTDFAGGQELDSDIFVSAGLKVLWPIYQLCKDRHSVNLLYFSHSSDKSCVGFWRKSLKSG